MSDTLMDATTPQETANQEQQDVSTDTEQQEIGPWDEAFDVKEAMNIATNKPAENNEESKEQDEAEQSSDVNLDELYKQQMADKDAKLDKPILVKYKGKVVDIDNVNELKDMAEKAIAATVKLQEAAELRKQFEGITPEDLELLRRFKSGDESVVAELATPRETVDTTADEVNQIATEILSAPYADQFKGFVGTLNPADKQILQTNPQILNGLKIDFENGLAQKIMPLAERKIAINGMDFLAAYTEAGKEVMDKGDTRKKSVDQLTAAPKDTTSVKTHPKEDVWSMDTPTFQKLFKQQLRR